VRRLGGAGSRGRALIIFEGEGLGGAGGRQKGGGSRGLG